MYEENWNEIVEAFRKNYNKTEDFVQNSWEFLCKLCFGYSSCNIESQYSVKMGTGIKKSDIVIKNEKEILLVIELKKHDLTPEKNKAQLFSYLNQLKVNIGILVCDNIYLYDYDYTVQGDKHFVAKISFKKYNPDGVKFVELFSKNNFDKEKIKEFIKDVAQKNEEELKRKKEEMNTRNKSQDNEERQSGKDFTEYKVNGVYAGGKGKTVYSVVELYVKNHPGISFGELNLVFADSKIKEGTKQIIRKWEDVKDWRRFDKKPLILQGGQEVAISNQWGVNKNQGGKGANWQYFLDLAEEIDINVEPIG